MNTITDAKTDEFIANVILSLHERIEVQVWIMAHRFANGDDTNVIKNVRRIQEGYKQRHPDDINSVGMLRYTAMYLEWLLTSDRIAAE